MVAAWARGEDGGTSLHALAGWQRALYRRVTGPGGVLERHPPAGARWVTLGDVLSGAVPLELATSHPTASSPTPSPGAAPLHVFGISYVARAFAALFERLAAIRPVWLFTLNPCMEFWEDVESPAELRRRLARTRAGARLGQRSIPAADEDPYELFQDTGNLPLRLWGRPGREHVMLLNEL